MGKADRLPTPEEFGRTILKQRASTATLMEEAQQAGKKREARSLAAMLRK